MIKQIALPKGSDGFYMLTKEAINILHKASKITVSYNKDVKTETYLEVTVSSKAGADMLEAEIRMPLNVILMHPISYFKASVSVYAFRTAIQAIVKENSKLIFEPVKNGLANEVTPENLVLDVIDWRIIGPREQITGIFAVKITNKSSNYQMIVL